MKSLQELCTSVIMSALLERRALDPDLLWDRLPPYVPPALRRSITTTYTTLEYHYVPFPTRADFQSQDNSPSSDDSPNNSPSSDDSPSGDSPPPTKVAKVGTA